MRIREAVRLAGYTTFGIGGPARLFVEAENEPQVMEASRWADKQGVPLFVLGGGSNLLVSDAGFDGLVLRIAIAGVERQGCVFQVGAGEGWDGFVDRAIAAGCAGVECLAGIPGSVGGTPVQNVGAYGQEVSETIRSVRALDRRTQSFVELSREECRFRYRESRFNTDEPGRYIVTRVDFELREGGVPTVRYADLQRRFAGESQPALREVAKTVRAIRREKGMVWVQGEPDTQSAGSFFKNPVVDEGRLEGVAQAAGIEVAAVPRYPAGAGRVKLPAAWLVERAGFDKGFGAELGQGRARISSRHTLALTNRGAATCAEMSALAEAIRGGVERRFGIRLEQEPVMLGADVQQGVIAN